MVIGLRWKIIKDSIVLINLIVYFDEVVYYVIRIFILIIESKIWYICWGNNFKVNCMRFFIEVVMIWDFN